MSDNNIIVILPYAVYCVSLADHLKHLPTGQVTAIIEMFLSHLHDNLPLEASNDSIATNGMYIMMV